jgi:hypothetical protein
VNGKRGAERSKEGEVRRPTPAPRFQQSLITDHQSPCHGFGLLFLAFDVAVDFGEDEVGG